MQKVETYQDYEDTQDFEAFREECLKYKKQFWVNIYLDMVTSLSQKDADKYRPEILKDIINIVDKYENNENVLIKKMYNYYLKFYGQC